MSGGTIVCYFKKEIHLLYLPPQDFADELDALPRITMVNNVIHNNEGYAVILVKPADLPLDSGPVGGLSAGIGAPIYPQTRFPLLMMASDTRELSIERNVLQLCCLVKE